jgi:hypothetical protein
MFVVDTNYVNQALYIIYHVHLVPIGYLRLMYVL